MTENYKSDYTVGDGADQLLFTWMPKGVTLHSLRMIISKAQPHKIRFSNNAVWPIYETDKIVVPFRQILINQISVITVFGKITIGLQRMAIVLFWTGCV